ncbi:MAG: ATP-binding cassette domain-containing protein [Clostridia bacterium]
MIKLENVSVSIKKNKILEDINIEFSEKKIYILVGENGCGKTILLKTILGFIPPDKGKVIINDIDIYNKNIFAPNSRAVLEKPEFIKEMTGLDNIKLLTQINNIVKDDEIEKWFAKFGLLEQMKCKVETYSLGMLQKLALVQVFVESPNIIVLDEPFNGLDKESIDILNKVIVEEKNKGKILIVTSHIDDNVNSLGDFSYKIEDKKISKMKS